MHEYLLTRSLDLRWIVAGLTLGAIIGYLAGTWGSPVATRRRAALWLSLGSALGVLFGVAEYHAALQMGWFVSHAGVAGLAIEVLIGAIAVTATIVAVAKAQAWMPPGPLRIPNVIFITATFTAFVLGMLVYLIIYPYTAWVFDLQVAMGFALGLLVAIPVAGAGLPRIIARVNAYAGVAACFAGFATGNALLLLIGALIAVAGFILSAVMRR